MASSKQAAPQAPQIPDYELLRLIGRGSYGDVWLARGVTGVWRAIKIVWRDRFPDAGPFEREFKGLKEFTAISLGQSVQMALLHVGRNDQAGYFYYVMELADDVKSGQTIDPPNYIPLTLAELRQRGTRTSAAECIRLGIELARALSGLHGRGLVHRDIKPSNIILVGGVAKLADIGLVAPTTDARTFVGTDGYVPPEGPGSPAADIYALGKVLFELSTGFDRQEFPQMPPGMHRLPDRRSLLELNEVILRSCDALPENRYRDGTALLADLEALARGHSLRGRRLRRMALPILAGCAAAVVAALLWQRHRVASVYKAQAAAAPASSVAAAEPIAMPEKSVAVLPFANLSAEKDSEYFADGVCEDVLTNLTAIQALRVSSRTSAQQYRDTKKPIPQIARELRVRYILEGSVQRSGNEVRVHGQLIEAATDKHVWAKSYSGNIDRLFALQAGIATDIADALHAVLSPDEKTTLERKPTENLEAYTIFMQGRAISHRSLLGGSLFAAAAKFREAVKMDPNFAEAWAALSTALTQLYFFEEDQSAESLASAKQAIDTAVRLAPDRPHIIESLGGYYFFGERDYTRATEQYLRLAQIEPHSAEVPHMLGLIQVHQGRWVDAIANSRRAVAMDPANVIIARSLILKLQWVRRYQELAELTDRLVREYPDEEEYWATRAQNAFNIDGSTALMAEFDRREFGPERAEHVLFLRRRLARMRGDFAAAVRYDHEASIFGHLGGWIQQMPAAISLENAGDVTGAQTLVRSIIEKMKAQAVREPDNSLLQAWLGQGYALLGEKELALGCAQRSLDLMPESKDSVFAVNNLILAGAVWARVGDKERALATFARCLQMPGGEHVSSARCGVSEAPNDISWRPIMNDPRYQALLADPKNNAPLR